MKKILIVLMMSFAVTAGHAQVKQDSTIKAAEFPGGEKAWYNYLFDNMKEPKNTGNAAGGQVTIKFTINKNGKVGSVEIVESAGAAFDRAAVKVVKHSPRWTPAMKDGKNVSSEQTATVQFAAPMEIKM